MAAIFIVEDDKNISEIESFALKNMGFSVSEFATAGAFFAALEKEKPALILLDIMLPDMDGLTVLEKLRKEKKTRAIPIIMVTAKSSEIDKVKGLDIGADDYITMPFGVMELISRVKALLRRVVPESEEKEITVGAVCLDDDKRQVTVSGQIIELTFKEFELLRLLMLRARIVTSREEILDKVWGTDFEGESRTLDMHIKTLRQKLGKAGAMIQTVRNVGYIFRE
jgi:two-component system alkaline phosphatase synthesis response regulator PhoP